MPTFSSDKTAYRALPLALLLLALATVFLFRGDRGHFYHAGVHDELTWNTMTVALNLSPEHDFLGLFRLTLDDDGNRTYEPYNRFPVLGYALIKLVTLPFHDDLSARLSAARTLMLAFYAGAATLAYLALCRLVRNRWAALAATLLSFSSLYAMYYNDAVTTEGAVGLFGVMLVFHGMAVFATEGRFGQLLAKTCMALLLDWHVYTLLLPFVLLGLVVAFRCRDGEAVRRHLVLGVVALVFGSMVLAANFTREYVALGGEVAPTELPSVKSMVSRTGIAPWFAFDSSILVKEQLRRIGVSSVPWAVGYFISDAKPDDPWRLAEVRMYVLLGLVLATGVVGTIWLLVFHRPSPSATHLPLAALALSQPCWAAAMRYNVHHGFESMYYVGIPLALFALMLPRLDRLLGGRVRYSVLAGVASAPMFVLASSLMARATTPDPESAADMSVWNADVESIRELVEGETIFVSEAMDACRGKRRCRADWPCCACTGRSERRRCRADWMYYFTGSVFAGKHLADFVVSERIEGARTRTPGNRFVFLYDGPGAAPPSGASRQRVDDGGDGGPVGLRPHTWTARPSTAGAPMARPVPRPPACPAQGHRSEGRHSSAAFGHI